MPNPCIIWGGWISPVTIIKEQPSISTNESCTLRQPHFSMTLPPNQPHLIKNTTLLPVLKAKVHFGKNTQFIYPTLALSLRWAARAPPKQHHLCACRAGRKTAGAKPMKPGWGQDDHAGCQHLSPADTSGSVCPSPAQCPLTHVTYPAPIRCQPCGEAASRSWHELQPKLQPHTRQDGSPPTPSVWLP